LSGDREIVRFAWQPYEASIVSIPADASVGIGRQEPIAEPEPKKEITIMADEVKVESRHNPKDLFKIANNLRGRIDGVDSLLTKAIEEEWTNERFQQEALNKLPSAKPMDKPVLADVPAKDWSNYSISRAIQGQLKGRLDGFEREMSEEFARTAGSPSGFWVPPQAMARNWTAATSTYGAMLVQTSNLGDQFIELLRNRAKVLQLGARTVQLSGPVTIPRMNASGTVNWVANTTAATLSTGNIVQITLTPKALTAFQQYDKALLFQGNPSVDALIRDDIMQGLAIEIDRAALHGAGTNEPTGIAATTGIGLVTLGANAAAFTSATAHPATVSLETEVAIDNADIGSLAYLTNAKVRGKLKVTDASAAANTAQWVWRPDNTLNGYRAEVSNQVSSILTKGTATTICSAIFFGNWSDLLIAQFNGGATDLIVDPYVLAVNGVVRVIAKHWCDVGVRHPESFAWITDILAG
jgi:HK97 family phage major capsid protein